MFRTFLSMLALSVFVALPAQAAGATQSPAVNRPPVKPDAVIVNLTTATTTDLETLPGIGARTALRILEYRQKNGQVAHFTSRLNPPTGVRPDAPAVPLLLLSRSHPHPLTDSRPLPSTRLVHRDAEPGPAGHADNRPSPL